jgi:aspartyl/asparaginyl beta-hydroxylase (cupin superfamily)
MDSGYSLESCNRIHIPIITNNEVYFTVGGERKNLKDGEMWQINNNNKMHSVENNSNQDRIHLITDWKLL